MRRIVVTGLGGVCPIGNDIETIWKNALAGKSGVGAVTALFISGLPRLFKPSKTAVLIPKKKICDASAAPWVRASAAFR